MIDLETAKPGREMMMSADVSSGVDARPVWCWSACPSLASPAAIASSVADDILPTATIFAPATFCLSLLGNAPVKPGQPRCGLHARRHGGYTREAIAERQSIRSLLRESRDLIEPDL